MSLNKHLISVFLATLLFAAALIHATEKNYYRKSALDFLLEYGSHYRLFDKFFNDTTGSLFTEPEQSIHRDVTEDYKEKDYSRYKEWFTAKVEMENPHSQVNVYSAPDFPQESPSPSALMQDNIYRFGPKYYQRFLHIGFSGDPWKVTLYDTSTILLQCKFNSIQFNLI